MEKTKLELLADQYRTQNIIKNTYQNTSGKGYGVTHPNAKSNGDNKGKGTGGNAELLNTTSGGGADDISSRDQLVAKNEAKFGSQVGPNGYGPNKPYYPNYILNRNR
jgi:hypothetical protein